MILDINQMAKKKYYTIPCIEMKQNDSLLYLFAEDAKKMWEVLSINRRVEDKDEGYQRVISGSRVKSISKYIEAKNPIPQSLLVSFEEAEIVDKKGLKFIRIEQKPDAGWVIDGQHRFAGANSSKDSIKLAFVAFVGLDLTEQIKLFITINQEAKGVPSSLYLDLLKSFPNKTPSEQAKERVADIATELKRDESSTFYNKIVVTTSPKTGELSLVNFVRKITPLVLPQKGILAVFTVQEQKAIINNYYRALSNIFPKDFNKQDSIFFQTLGFGALINALPTFFTICFRENKGFTVEDATKIFKRIEYFDFSQWKSKGTGSSAELEAGNDLTIELNSMFDLGGNVAGTLRV